ncbi:winged helix-turn-helix domain-containing protein [Actinacidiphila acidipaludis]|uniref:Winged helix-turn-helix domain-containing protein n=1 Tax=Actinacidiphila acidipaludis TaxID=2873382 RepID=A0ABS7Q5B6_9ACTN|nr:winged helix-turn-helix domain-containing protein [Streptomyces acidipaludis]MBY8878349.1 winged helix-turn-helix domain-containing protein [Streptomyces acidipaludis]
MSNVSSIPPLPATTASASAAPAQAAQAARQHLRAVRAGEAPPAPDFLPPGATWMPAPGHVLSAVSGGTPMVGYLVLVPAEQGADPSAVPPGPGPATAQDPAAAPLRVDGERRTAEVDGRALELTYLEFELLAHLVAHPHRVHSRDHLVSTVWGYGHIGDGRTVDVHIARLRRKLGAEHRGSIVTVRRVGYKYAPATGTAGD